MRTPQEDKRRYIRYEIIDLAAIRVDSVEDPIRGMIVDIGLGGLQLRARAELPSGTSCQVTVGTNAEPLFLQCEVRHCSLVDEQGLFSLGVRFMPRNHEERMAIAEYVHDVFQRQCDLLAT